LTGFLLIELGLAWFHSIPFHSIPFHSMQFHAIPCNSIQFHQSRSMQFNSIQFHSIPFHSTPFDSAPFYLVSTSFISFIALIALIHKLNHILSSFLLIATMSSRVPSSESIPKYQVKSNQIKSNRNRNRNRNRWVETWFKNQYLNQLQSLTYPISYQFIRKCEFEKILIPLNQIWIFGFVNLSVVFHFRSFHVTHKLNLFDSETMIWNVWFS
jgi:hypothetical protein